MHGKNAKESAPQVSWNARITKYAGLIFFRISVYKKPGGGPPSLRTTVENRRTMRLATAGRPAQAGPLRRGPQGIGTSSIEVMG